MCTLLPHRLLFCSSCLARFGQSTLTSPEATRANSGDSNILLHTWQKKPAETAGKQGMGSETRKNGDPSRLHRRRPSVSYLARLRQAPSGATQQLDAVVFDLQKKNQNLQALPTPPGNWSLPTGPARYSRLRRRPLRRGQPSRSRRGGGALQDAHPRASMRTLSLHADAPHAS
jgi:hypothetical protein